MTTEEAADEFAEQVAVTHRYHGDIHIGREEFSTITAAVRAAFIAGAKSVGADSGASQGQERCSDHPSEPLELVCPTCFESDKTAAATERAEVAEAALAAASSASPGIETLITEIERAKLPLWSAVGGEVGDPDYESVSVVYLAEKAAREITALRSSLEPPK